MFTSIASVLGINLITSIFKSAVAKFGDTGVHLIVLACSIVVTVVWAFAQTNPSVMTLIEHAGVLGLAAIGTYEAVWKQIATVVTTPTVQSQG